MICELEEFRREDTLKGKKNIFFLCPKCEKGIPVIQEFFHYSGTDYIRAKCDCGEIIEDLTTFIQSLKKIKLPNKDKCNTYLHSNRDSELYCLNCSKNLCNDCFTSHNTNFPFHTTSPFKLEAPKECKKHLKTFDNFCNDCDEAVCNTCVTKNHKGHKNLRIEEILNYYKEQNIKSVFEKIKSNQQYLKEIQVNHLKFLKLNPDEKLTKVGTVIENEFKKTVQRLVMQYELIESLLYGIFIQPNNILFLHNFLSIGEVLPLHSYSKGEKDPKYYLNFLKQASFIDKKRQIVSTFLTFLAKTQCYK